MAPPTCSGKLEWTEAVTEEIAEGVYRIPLPIPHDSLRAVNIYALKEPNGVTLIDGGQTTPDAIPVLSGGLARIDRDILSVNRILVTHVHRDHYSNALGIRRTSGARVGLGCGEAKSLSRLMDPSYVGMSSQLTALRRLGAGSLADEVASQSSRISAIPLRWEAPDEWIDPGPVELPGRSLVAIDTPGHTAGHLVFHDSESRLLFSGDHVLSTITPSIGFEAVVGHNPLGAYLRSLARIRALPDTMLLPAHGPTASSTHRRVDELLAHHDARLDAVERALEGGAGTAYAVAQSLLWTRRKLGFDELDPFNAMLAVLEVGSHIEVLVAQDRIDSGQVDERETGAERECT